MLPSRPMIRRAFVPLAPVVLALAACATQATPPPPATLAPTPATPVAQAEALLPPVPQPPERPLAPQSVSDPAIPLLVRRTLAQAEYRQSIIDAINRPAEKVRPWRDYRPIFLNDARIEGGRAFYAANRQALDDVAARTGVPAGIITAIIGVETSYGRITGSYRVLDALYTLAFWHPRRAPFFAGELAQLFALVKEEPQLDILALKGSYAGAMGMGQFMPSSYRNWAVDGDGDGRRDLLTHTPDVFASIANYFVVHGWQRDGAVVARATRDAGAADFVPGSLDPVYPLAALAARGYRPQPGQPLAEGATLVTLEGDAGPEYWLGYRNFYVITRYNHSPMYAMAVYQLAQAIRGNPAP